jgi:hypothetical protein
MLLFAEARASNTVLGLRKVEVRHGALSAIRDLEQRVVDVLGENGRLRGMPNLGTRRYPHYAVRIVQTRERAPLPKDGREVLVIGACGRLEMAHQDFVKGFVSSRPVRDDELNVEDLSYFARIVAELLERHVALTNKRTRELERTARLAERIFQVIREEAF